MVVFNLISNLCCSFNFKIAVFITAIFLGNNVFAKELYQEAIDWFTGRNGHPVSIEEAKRCAVILKERKEIVGFCILGSIAQLEGERELAQDLYFEAFSSGDLIRYTELEPDVGNFFLGEYYMVADPVDLQKANDHYKISANLGFGCSMASYGVNRLIGHGISQNRYEAKEYLIEGMRRNSPHAYYNFAIYLLAMANERKVTAKAYLEYASYRGFKLAKNAIRDWY
jgi:TPR repeat protein